MPLIAKNLKTGECHVEFELDEAELCAIGRVTAQWAYLEHGIYALTDAIANFVGTSVPQDALHTSFKRRLAALRLLVEEFAAPEERGRMTSLIGKIANAEQDRHKITHAMWDWDPANAERIKASSFRRGFEFEKAFNAATMNRLADRIGAISFALEHPDGWDGAFRDLLSEHADAHGKVAYAYISRRLHRELSSQKARDQTERDQAKPPEGKPPRPS